MDSSLDKKKLLKIKEDYLKDCKYDLVTFQVRLMTEFFRQEEKKIVSSLIFIVMAVID